ncbi:hypothetical protein [Ponticoccus sp. (in: a-proteobacteria)]|uniref:hypothetical protein n=1 Tax=Ponticoccus sp. (in: a-proteobacteria) TaxID=1925025 RepID=UPI003AB4B4D3
MRAAVAMVVVLAVAGCGEKGLFTGQGPFGKAPEAASAQAAPAAEAGQAAPATAAVKPPAGARTVEQFDTTTPEERVAAAAAPVEPAGERSLGTTVASLGEVAEAGFWLKTPLVTERTRGRVLNPASGKSAQVDLIPIDGPASAGSRISLAAMRLLEAPLTDLPTVEVFTGG